MKIPLRALSNVPAGPGVKWRANFYRIDRAKGAFIAANPTLNGSFHTPSRFAWLEFLP
jgi:hypothetical protein